MEAFRGHSLRPSGARPKVQLTPKETLIVSCVTQGMKNKEIAIRVGTTEQVVKNYLRKVYDKLGVADRLELALYCLSHHVVDNTKVSRVAGICSEWRAADRRGRAARSVIFWSTVTSVPFQRILQKNSRKIPALFSFEVAVSRMSPIESCWKANWRQPLKELLLPTDLSRRDGRVAEGARLESVFRGNSNVGSNPTLSASFLPHKHRASVRHDRALTLIPSISKRS